ncbi:MAG: hotdog fold thioesterase [Bifidobacteriaceae bacterium]|nr:hotdog fold thioesterase [Bifidobacteriaceae bacterium]
MNEYAGRTEANQFNLGELERKLGLEILECTLKQVVGRIPVESNRQPWGRLHGGACLALGETLGSLAASLHAAAQGLQAVGVDVNATHHAAANSGWVTGTASPLHLGRRLTTHQVVIEDQTGRRISTLRITNLLIEPEP